MPRTPSVLTQAAGSVNRAGRVSFSPATCRAQEGKTNAAILLSWTLGRAAHLYLAGKVPDIAALLGRCSTGGYESAEPVFHMPVKASHVSGIAEAERLTTDA